MCGELGKPCGVFYNVLYDLAILCRLGRARDSQAEIPDKAGAPCQIELL